MSILLILSSCGKEPIRQVPGICLSFDDRNIQEWYALRDLFKEHNAQVTFFITQPHELDSTEISMLRELQSDGHEIGFHGTKHVLSENFIKEYGYREYLKTEIEDGMNVMKQMGFEPRSFAYPYGAKYWFTDFLIGRKFEKLRGVSPLNIEKTWFLLMTSITISMEIGA